MSQPRRESCCPVEANCPGDAWWTPSNKGEGSAPRPCPSGELPAQKALAHCADLGRGGSESTLTRHSTRRGPPRHPARPRAQDRPEREDPILTAGVSLRTYLVLPAARGRKARWALAETRGGEEKPSCVLNSVSSCKFISSPFAKDRGKSNEKKTGPALWAPMGRWCRQTGPGPGQDA